MVKLLLCLCLAVSCDAASLRGFFRSAVIANCAARAGDTVTTLMVINAGGREKNGIFVHDGKFQTGTAVLFSSVLCGAPMLIRMLVGNRTGQLYGTAVAASLAAQPAYETVHNINVWNDQKTINNKAK